MVHASYVMHFRHDSVEDMEKLQILCEMLRQKNNCFSITDIEIRGKKGYEVWWYIKNDPRLTRFGVPDGRRH